MADNDLPLTDPLSPRNEYARWLGAMENRQGPLDDNFDALLLKVTAARDRLGIAGLEDFWVERFRAYRKKAKEESSAAFTKGLFWGVGISGAVFLAGPILRWW